MGRFRFANDKPARQNQFSKWRSFVEWENISNNFVKGRVQSVCKQSLRLHFGIQNIELYSTTIYTLMLLQYINKLSRYNSQALQEHKMK